MRARLTRSSGGGALPWQSPFWDASLHYELAAALIAESALPAAAKDDASHIALAAVHGMDYLLTWNCRHIDNAETKPVIRSVCAKLGYA